MLPQYGFVCIYVMYACIKNNHGRLQLIWNIEQNSELNIEPNIEPNIEYNIELGLGAKSLNRKSIYRGFYKEIKLKNN